MATKRTPKKQRKPKKTKRGSQVTTIAVHDEAERAVAEAAIRGLRATRPLLHAARDGAEVVELDDETCHDEPRQCLARRGNAFLRCASSPPASAGRRVHNSGQRRRVVVQHSWRGLQASDRRDDLFPRRSRRPSS